MKKGSMQRCLLVYVFISLVTISLSFSSSASSLQVSFGQNPLTIAPGTHGYIEVIIKNVGSSDVNTVDVDLRSVDYTVIKPWGNWDVTIDSVGSGESTTELFEFYVADDAADGLYQVIAEVENGKQTFLINVQQLSPLDITSVSPQVIPVGQASTISFNITNCGGKALKNIFFSWADESNYILPINADNQLTISSIGADCYTLVPITVSADPSMVAGVYPLSITMMYYDGAGVQQTMTSTVGIQISGGTDFEIVQQQSTSGVSLAIANTGANTASSVIAFIPVQPGYTVTGSSSVNLGNLDAGDYTLASFQVSSSQSGNVTGDPGSGAMRPGNFGRDFNQESGQIPEDFRDFMQNRSAMGMFGGGNALRIQVTYTDLFGVRQTVEKEVVLSSSLGSSALSSLSGVSSRFGNVASDQTSGLDSSTVYIMLGVLGIICVVVLLKFGTIKKKIQTVRSRHSEKK